MKKNILFIMHLPPPVHGASMVGKYIQESKKINESFECGYINLATADSLEGIGKMSFEKMKVFCTLFIKILSAIRKKKPDLVYVTPNAKGVAFYKDFLIVQFLKTIKCKVIVHYHNKGVFTRQNGWFDNLLYKSFFRNIKVILLGKSLYEDVKKYVRREDVYICPNGIPVVKKRIDEKKKETMPHLLFLSNLLESKGVWVLLDGLQILRRRGFSFFCDFVGDTSNEIDEKRFAKEVDKRGINQCVKYHGKKYGDEKENILERSDMFILPTFYHNECFPLVLLEAMQYGLPCISTNEGAIADIIDNGVNGCIVEKRNCEELAICISSLMSDTKKMKRMGENARRKFTEEFTLEIFENRFCDILRNVIQ